MKRSVLLILLGLMTLSACQPPGEETGAKSDDEEKEPEPVPVEIANLSRGTVDATYVGTATLEADGEAVVKAKVNGEIVALLVEEGDQVRAGQALARIDSSRLTLEVERAKANMDKVNQDYNRNVELHEKGLLPAGVFEGMRYDLDALEATYKLAQLELSYATIRAPIAGVISARSVKAGNNIAIGEALFTITDLDPLLAYLHIPERDFQKLRAKQKVDLRVDAIAGQQFVGEIARVSPTVDSSTGTFKATIEVSDDTGALKPGMFGRVAIVYETFTDAVLAPRSAIIDNNGSPTVFIADATQNTARQQTISTGHINGGYIQVTSGLNGTEQVVVIGQNGLKDNGLIKIINADSATLVNDSDRPEEDVAVNN